MKILAGFAGPDPDVGRLLASAARLVVRLWFIGSIIWLVKEARAKRKRAAAVVVVAQYQLSNL